MMDAPRDTTAAALSRLIAVVGQWYRHCPWAREQTFSSLRPYVLEEAQEVADELGWCAATPKDAPVPASIQLALREEVGDLLLQVVQICELAQQQGWFSVLEVIEEASAKVVRRNPHIFGTATANTVEEVNALWRQVRNPDPLKGDGLAQS
jgi:uncharacterized protein YabN with tetrapyrrole methylase and pyrophosphatase domain